MVPEFLLLVILSAVIAWLSYRQEQPGRRGVIVPIVLRTLATVMLGVLLLDGSCARFTRDRPIVLVDASLSMGQSPERWRAARDSAARLGDVRFIGEVSRDSSPSEGYSRIAPTAIAAAATGRPVWLVTDGEVSDAVDLPSDIRQSLGVVILPRNGSPDYAVIDVRGPNRIARDDSLELRVEVRGPDTANRSITLDLLEDTTSWASQAVKLTNGFGQARITAKLPKGSKPGDHILTIALKGVDDAEPRTDRRLHPITVLPTPGIIVLVEEPGWESKFLVRTLADVAGVPVRAFLSLEDGSWQRSGDLAVVRSEEVDRSARAADLLVTIGSSKRAAGKNRAIWNWPASDGATGDWYVAAPLSPIGTPFAGLTLDSTPPLQAIKDPAIKSGDWVALSGQLNRRGGPKPLVFGREQPSGQRMVTMAAAGFWRWAFRGGPHGDGYRSLVSSITAWLLGASDSTSAAAHPINQVVSNGRRIVFERTAPSTVAVPIELRGEPTSRGGESPNRVDTLRFDGTGRAEIRLGPGIYRYRLGDDRTEGLLGVEEYSEEYLARPITLQPRPPAGSSVGRTRSIRDSYPLFFLIIAALAGEWWWRRRTGLR